MFHVPQSTHPLDKLPWTENQPCPAPDAIRQFQQRLTEAVGLSEGHPLVRVVWGGQEMEFGCEEMRAKYLFSSAELPIAFKYADLAQAGKAVLVPSTQAPDGITPADSPELFVWERFDIGVQRFVLEVHVPRAVVAPDWEFQRYMWDADLRAETDRWTARTGRERTTEEEQGRVDVLGPCPDPFYQALFTVAEHRNCCNGRGSTKDGRICFGLFRMPNDSDIARVQGMLRGRERAKQARRADEPITKAELVTAAKNHAQKAIEQDRRRSARIQERVADWMKVHGHRLTEGDPSVLSQGKYHFLTGSKAATNE